MGSLLDRRRRLGFLWALPLLAVVGCDRAAEPLISSHFPPPKRLASAAATTVAVAPSSVGPETTAPTSRRTAPLTAAPTFNPDGPPPSGVDLCAQPANVPPNSVSVLLTSTGAPPGSRARGQLTSTPSDDSLDANVYGCGLDISSPNHYYAQLISGGSGCNLSDPAASVYLQVGYLNVETDGRTEVAHGSTNPGSPQMPPDSWIAIYDAGPNATRRSDPQLIFCGRMTH
ncbi:MAG: hypothetical protein ACYDAC_06285 [Candidatus Dormibacteria bacterium]